MTSHNRLRRAGMATVVIALLLSTPTGAQPQAQPSAAELGAQLRARYDVVALQDGIALVPREAGAGVRMIQVAGGVVMLDGDVVTGSQLSERLGQDASLVLQISYLDPEAQRALAASPSGATPLEQTGPPQVRRGDVVRIGGPVTISGSERVEGDVVSVFGPVTIEGEVTREVTVVMAPLTLGPRAVVRGDVTVVGGPLNRAEGSVILGRIEEVGFGPFGDGPMVRRAIPGGWWFPGPLGPVGPFGRGFGSLAGTLTRIVLLALLGFVALAAARGLVERVGDRAAEAPVRSGFVGLLAELLFIPALVAIVVVLAVSIVGIPLLLLVPFGVAAGFLLMFVGFVAVAKHVGVLIARRLGWEAEGPYFPLAVGIVTVAGVTLVARLAALMAGDLLGAPVLLLGYAIEYVAWTVGLGAVILAWSEGRRVVAPPPSAPMPPAPMAS